jgi:hypothetical protein
MSKCYIYILILAVILTSKPTDTFSQSNQFGFGSFYSGTRDFVEISYGLGDLKHNNLNTSFNSFAQNEIILGRRTLKPIVSYKLIKFSDNYLYSSYVEDYKEGSNNDQKLSFDIWRFGFGYRKGFGYNFGSIAILPYYHMGLGWNKINLSLPNAENPFVSSEDLAILQHYEDQIKFGTSNIGGVDIRISQLFGIGASYETAVIFPYYKVWKQFGSFFIETIAQTGIDFLTEGVIIKAMPEVAPVFYFIVKNGLSYFFYTLKQEEMNWPFDTKAPLTLETVKFSLKITF